MVTLGLKENWKQFTLLVIVNSFVGGMIGLERTILPEIAEEEFKIAAKTAIFSFIVVFGFTKAVSNYVAGSLANRLGRKKLLIIGWLFALPVPFILIYASHWNWVIVANVFLGINQGLTWSTTVLMKIDLVGNKNRGLAMGLNEFSGYLSVGVVAFATGWIASEYGLRPYPFYLGIAFATLGLLVSIFLIKDTTQHMKTEMERNDTPKLKNIFWDTTFTNKNLSTVTQAGFINNLNDAMMWGLLPIILSVKGFSIDKIGLIAATYPMVWGVSQLFTGGLADRVNKKTLLFLGMLLQGVSIIALIWSSTFSHYMVLATTLGIGTAMVYPTFFAFIADVTHPVDRSESIGVFRFWRDNGYVAGAILTGLVADYLGVNYSILIIGSLTLFSSLIIKLRMSDTTSDYTILANHRSK